MKPHDIIQQFAHKKIAVIGDIMLDRYVYGSVDRISPEAPIPIVMKRETQLVPGGAGNTAANVTALGAKCNLFGVIGDDLTGKELLETLKLFSIETVGLLRDNRPTTEKTRILGNHQQIVRIDHESTRALDETVTDKLCQRLKKVLPTCDAVIVCDYAKGVIQPEIMDCIRQIAKEHNLPVLADVRPEHKAYYHDLDFITPNRKEMAGMTHAHVGSVEQAKEHGLALARELKTSVLVTMSEAGMLVIDHQSGAMTHLPTKAQEVTDVSGAGDTVIATMALGLASGANSLTAATIANHAASVVVAKLGTATLTTQELITTF